MFRFRSATPSVHEPAAPYRVQSPSNYGGPRGTD